jgi:hypothetical protein
MPSLTREELSQFSSPDITCFVETGTYEGDTTAAAASMIKKVYSIEINPVYVERVKQRFQHTSNIEIIQGDSSVEISRICSKLQEPTLFWLDGHWSGGDTGRGAKDCPLIEEVETIVNQCRPRCILAIDDVRLFNTKINEDWTEITLGKINSLVSSRLEALKFYPSEHHPKDRLVITLGPI